MKLVYLIDRLKTLNGGSERQLQLLSCGLAARGHEAHIITLSDSSFWRDLAATELPGVHRHCAGIEGRLELSLGGLKRLHGTLRKIQPDIVHTFFPGANSIGAIVARLAGCPRIFTSRRDMGFSLTRKERLLYRLNRRLVTGIIANSSAVLQHAQQLEHFPISHGHVIYNGIEIKPDYCATADTNGPVRVGIAANFSRHVKRVDLFIKAAALLAGKYPSMEFWILGDGWLRQELEQLTRTLKVDQQVIFFGRASDLPTYFRQMHIAVICSDSEGLSNSIMEYMLHGLPVIATNVGGNPDLVIDQKTGLLIPPGSETELAKAIEKLADDPELRARMSKHAQEAICQPQKFSVASMLDAHENLYRQA